VPRSPARETGRITLVSITEVRHLKVDHGTCVMTVTSPCASVASSHVGVVIVPPFGIERSGADRLLVALAHELAGAGHTAMLIDPVGTGDSSDLLVGDADRPANLVASFAHATLAAIAALRSRGFTSCFVVGIRFGALAMVSALSTSTDTHLDGAVLWSPVASGRTYRRELLMLGSSTSAGLPEGWSAPGGNIVGPDDLKSLSRLGLAELQPPASRILVVSTHDTQLSATVTETWSRTAPVDLIVDDALALARLEDPELGDVPTEAITRVTQWITTTAAPPQVERSGRATTVDRRTVQRALEGPGWTEFPVGLRMDDATVLTAMVTRPSSTPRAALVLLSTGTNPRFGPGRFHVRVARRLALAGFATLRVERRGASSANPTFADAYDPRHIDDAIAILRQAPAIAGTDRLVLAGTCSGAWAAWHGALHGFDGTDVGEVVLINQIIFGEDSWDLTNDSPAIAVKTRQSLSNAKQWKAVLRGEINVPRSARRLVRYAALTAKNRLHGFDGLAGDLEIVRRNGVPTTFLFDDEETGLVYLRMHGNGHLKALIHSGQLRVHTVSGAGHVFSSPASVDWLSGQLTEALERVAR
jgi:hypothetical protein